MGLDSRVVWAEGLCKYYGEVAAVNGIDFAVRRGECFGFLGPNGAGKTTTIRMIACVSPPSGGKLCVEGLDVTSFPRRVKQLLGVVPQENNLDLDLTLEENLLIYGTFYGLPREKLQRRAVDLLRLFDLLDRRAVPAEQLSGGLKRRLILARSLVPEPRVLLLDEPTAGLDPQARHLLWQHLRQLKAGGLTLILTTHYLEEAAQLCDRLVIMDQGRILVEGSPGELVAGQVGSQVVEVSLAGCSAGEVVDQLAGELGGYQVLGQTLFLYPRDPARLLERLRLAPWGFDRQVVRPAGLEDVFLKLTGRSLEQV